MRSRFRPHRQRRFIVADIAPISPSKNAPTDRRLRETAVHATIQQIFCGPQCQPRAIFEAAACAPNLLTPMQRTDAWRSYQSACVAVDFTGAVEYELSGFQGNVSQSRSPTRRRDVVDAARAHHRSFNVDV